MQRTSFSGMACPIARSLEHVGEWWSILVLREAFNGRTRFDEFRDGLGMAPNILTRRLKALVAAGLMERRLYCDRPPRYEYILTAKGRDFRPVMLSLMTWGNRHFSPDGITIQMVNAETGEPAEPVLIDQKTGLPIDGPDYKVWRRNKTAA